MKKIMLLFVFVLVMFTLSACTEEKMDVTVIVYSENPDQLIEDLEDLPELLAIELAELGIDFNRVVVQSSNDVSVIETSLVNGDAVVAILDPSLVQSNDIVRVLDVMKDEVNHPLGDMDRTTYQQAIVVANTVDGNAFLTAYETTPTYTLFNGLNVCSTATDSGVVEDFAITLGASSINDVTLNHTTSSTLEVYEGLEDGTCDIGVVTLEEVHMYESIWQENDLTVYEDVTVLYTFEPLPYDGVYAASGGDQVLINAVMQSLIQISSHNVNSDILDVLGHQGYYISEE